MKGGSGREGGGRDTAWAAAGCLRCVRAVSLGVGEAGRLAISAAPDPPCLPPCPLPPQVRAAGMVINSMGWIEDLGYELLMHSAAALKADVVLVVGSERLYSQVSADLRGKGEEGGLRD